jgi:hypothetical protein
MKKIICAAALAILAMNAPAHAQLTPVYGWLRTALENSMAQSLPPYGKQERSAAPEAAAQDTANSPSAQDRQQDATMKNAAAAEQEK